MDAAFAPSDSLNTKLFFSGKISLRESATGDHSPIIPPGLRKQILKNLSPSRPGDFGKWRGLK
jgi:hypothetical protein